MLTGESERKKKFHQMIVSSTSLRAIGGFVNFSAYEITRNALKLAETPTIIKKKKTKKMYPQTHLHEEVLNSTLIRVEADYISLQPS